jgi:hypothetical protein
LEIISTIAGDAKTEEDYRDLLSPYLDASRLNPAAE